MTNMKKILYLVPVLALLVMMGNSVPVNAQTGNPGFRLSIETIKMVNDQTMEFDLKIYSTDAGKPFELALLQAGILVNPAFYEGGKLTAAIVSGSSQLDEQQKPQSIVFVNESNIIKLPSRTLKPLPKDAKPEKRGTIISTDPAGTRICTIRLTNTVAFAKAPANLAFNFAKLPYTTSVSRYIDGINTPLVCNEKNCVVKL
jgi:hypothetical protein